MTTRGNRILIVPLLFLTIDLTYGAPCDMREVKPSFSAGTVIFDAGAWRVQLKGSANTQHWDPSGDHEVKSVQGMVICSIESQPVQKVFVVPSRNEIVYFMDYGSGPSLSFFDAKSCHETRNFHFEPFGKIWKIPPFCEDSGAHLFKCFPAEVFSFDEHCDPKPMLAESQTLTKKYVGFDIIKRTCIQDWKRKTARIIPCPK